MRILLVLLLAACPKKSEPQEPTPPPPADAGVDAAPTPLQTQASGTIRASSYAQNCTRDDECVGVFEGDGCNPCRCAFNAIRADAFPKYKSDLGQFWSCRKEAVCDCRQDIGVAAKCEAGTCVLPP
ncbi:MAG: hypothetical protein M4D80_04685 [Myxococcota bacterium]|nr:hypothetical protein [Deltaproteobacteria bacterium]MDQ3334435.1 hypothetical protein [Myxococcota bacterium]